MKKVLLILFLICLGQGINAQSSRGAFASSFGLTGGYVEDGVGLMFNYNHHISRFSYFNIGALVTVQEDRETDEFQIPYNLITFQPGYFVRVFQNQWDAPLTFYVGIGAIGGYEVLNNGSVELPNGAILDGKSKFIFGGFAAAEMDITINNSLAILVKGTQYYHANSDIGDFVPYVGAGLRYYFE